MKILTPAEAEIALFVAKGLTNQRIAAQRQCSVRTVESHVRKVLQKLGIGSRTSVLPWLLTADLPHIAQMIREERTP